MSAVASRVRFGSYEVRTNAGELLLDGHRVPIQRQPFELLVCLLEQPGRIVERHELYARLWKTGVFVDFEHGLNTLVRKLRRALGDPPDQPKYVETIAGRGYRFVGVIESARRDAPALFEPATDSARRSRALLARPPFVGRERELARLEGRLSEAIQGRGGLLLVAGEPGIGKTRLLEELAAEARRRGARVLSGRSVQGEGPAPYAPFSEAISSWIYTCDAAGLRDVTDDAAWAVIARMVPLVRTKLHGLPEPPALQPNEERLRLFDAIAQLVRGLSKRHCLLFAIDDLHWADAATIALLGHVARIAASAPLLVAGAYRDSEVDRDHPLARLFDAFARETGFDQLALAGLRAEAIRRWLDQLVATGISPALADEMLRTTNGNPFFLREVVLDWHREGRLETGDLPAPARIGVPEGVRAMVEQSLAKLSEDARRLLEFASAFPAVFYFEPVANAARLEEAAALDALDEACRAQLVRECGGPDDYEFVHALIRSALYESLTPARRIRMHRRLAGELEREAEQGGPAHTESIAEHYHASREIPGAASGVPYAIAAAERAELAADLQGVTRWLGRALELLPPGDSRTVRLHARRALALAWGGEIDDAVRQATAAGDAIAAREGADAAADFLAEAADAIWRGESDPRAWILASHGLRFIGDRRDHTWMRLATHALVAAEASDPIAPGLPRDTPLRREVFAAFLANRSHLSPAEQSDCWRIVIFDSREQVIERAGDLPSLQVFCAGEFRGGLAGFRRLGSESLARHELASAITFYLQLSGAEVALGELDAAERSLQCASDLLHRVEVAAYVHLIANVARGCVVRARGVGIAEAAASLDSARRDPRLFPALALIAPSAAVSASLHALAGHAEEMKAALELARHGAAELPGWAPNYTLLVGAAADALWTLGVADPRNGGLERNLRDKTLTPDFRYPNVDARLALAKLCGLDRRYDEAAHWFDQARAVLDEQGARPLRAITDYDEALMYARRGAGGDAVRVCDLLDAAVRQFEVLGMPGWIERAERLGRGESS